MQHLREQFRERFQKDSTLYRAPGRVNLIGEHTDYNQGFVMPAALDFATWVAAAPRDDRRLRMHSVNLEESVEVDLDREPRPTRSWSDYVVGVALALDAPKGADLLIDGRVPLGSGLSSSAALEVACGYALAHLNHRVPPLKELATLCQKAENEFVGTRCGIMDQYISCCGKKDHALMLDCRSLEHRLLPLPDSVRLVVCNSLVKHSLVDGEYNRRREACEEAAQRLGLDSLRDAQPSDVERLTDDVVRRRCRHVVSEVARVEQAAAALDSHDLERFGRLMGESHRSLRDDYEVSCPELDCLVELAESVPGVYGSRMTGGGFGGCTVSLVAKEAVEELKDRLTRGYHQHYGRDPEVYVCTPSDGVGPA